MPRKKKPRDDAKRAKASSRRKTGQPSRRDPQPSPLDVLSPLADLPLEVRRKMLGSLVGDEMADELLAWNADDEPPGDTAIERQPDDANSASTSEEPSPAEPEPESPEILRATQGKEPRITRMGADHR